ncbi:MAG TPA: tyrosine--tRNA ligase [Candidatus Paceibacterota bacterium]|nr:tyrosine--tRNA ligase [Candidatus Paceibacterota bacterium]
MESRTEQIDQLLSRNVEEVIERDHLRAALAGGKKLRVKLGIDPTSPDLHLGHAVVLRKLKAFQDLGHVAVLIIGDFTAQIGDPSMRVQARKPLTAEEVKKNEKKYLDHAATIIDVKKAEIFHNSDWMEKETLEELMKLIGTATFQQVMHRADFKKRIDRGEDITLLELLYPLLQGYDSVKVRADVELGGTDQLFNLLMGRQVQKRFNMPEQDVMTVPLLVGLDGEKKMSKSLGNYIGLHDAPEDMFGKVMSLPDALMEKYFILCTDLSEDEVAKLKKELKPKALKERLGSEIVKLYHGEAAARGAQERFEQIFSKREMPEDLPELAVAQGETNALELVMATKTVKSKSEARRLIEQGGFEFDGKTVGGVQEVLKVRGGEVVKLGKKRLFRLKI